MYIYIYIYIIPLLLLLLPLIAPNHGFLSFGMADGTSGRVSGTAARRIRYAHRSLEYGWGRVLRGIQSALCARLVARCRRVRQKWTAFSKLPHNGLEELRGCQGVGVVSNNWFDCVLLNYCSCSNHHADRCSKPLPWDPRSSPQSIPKPIYIYIYIYIHVYIYIYMSLSLSLYIYIYIYI